MSTTFFFRSGEIELPEEPARLRSHAALVRGLVDEIERIAPVPVRSSDAAVFAEMGEQLAEEVARLGYRMLECAAAIVRSETLGASGRSQPTSPAKAPAGERRENDSEGPRW